ncbi:MAG: D-glycerate dehydrogenase [Novosphingobium sp.]|nr:D-glycerate dehydrogenase [Novosphingobium sp.]MBO9603814.1 D-glycerate dehydrogenase [Novosphingobium sp.]
MSQTKPPARPRVIVTRPLPGVEPKMLELFDTVLNPEDRAFTREELLAAMRDCDVLVPNVTDKIDAGMIEQAGDRIKLIANFGAGVDHLDIPALKAKGMAVTNTPDVFTDDTADITMALILTATRRLSEGIRMVAAGEWDGWAPSRMLGRNLRGKLLGIVGMGAIGKELAIRARAFGMEVAYNNRRRLPEAEEAALGVRFEPGLELLIRSADYLSLNCPSTPETRGMLNAERIAAMKPGSFVINSGRGDLIDEPALIAALESGHLGGAGLDVFVGEPNIRPEFMHLKNVTALPHLGSATVEGRTEAGEKIIRNIQAWIAGEPLPDAV